MVKRFEETTYLEYLDASPRIDRESGVIYGVKLLGENSRNGRRYKAEAMRKAVGLYEETKMHLNHPGRKEMGEDRRFETWGGVFKNARYVEGKGIFADAHLRKSGEYFEGILEAAEKFPNAVGFSHVADGESKIDGDTEIIESIREVFSVDLVCDPATTNGFFESTMKTKKKQTVKQIAESLPEGTTRKVLLESAAALAESGYELGAFDMGEDPAPVGDTGITQQLVDSLTAIIQGLMTVLAKGKAAAPAVPPAAPPAADPPAPEEDPMEKEKMAALESENAQLKAKALLLESGREATEIRVKALANTAEADREALLESWPVQEGGERPIYSPPLMESEGDADFDFSQPGSFARRYR
jgi:hypothetical protein